MRKSLTETWIPGAVGWALIRWALITSVTTIPAESKGFWTTGSIESPVDDPSQCSLPRLATAWETGRSSAARKLYARQRRRRRRLSGTRPPLAPHLRAAVLQEMGNASRAAGLDITSLLQTTKLEDVSNAMCQKRDIVMEPKGHHRGDH
ncbi:hypothetical protein T484DRAFT_1777309 [Baffinella frigidus]|nr:hypothetical protein T484DRAFT_1777309 [Cryptophyta sp. CCMP2293]